jgi:thiamine-phosphate pyrophosphorylase
MLAVPHARLDPRLYVLVDPARAGGHDIVSLALAAIAGGATLLQYRDKTASTRTLVARSQALKAAITGSGVPLVVNDRVDVAMAAGADGVHLGQDDMNVTDARRLMGARAIIGTSVTTEAHARALAGAGLDYAFVGAVFATLSKHDGARPIGLGGLAHLVGVARRAAPGLPVGAISGIDAMNAAAAIEAGAEGIAVISAVSGADDPAAATRRLRSVVDEALRWRGAEAPR